MKYPELLTELTGYNSDLFSSPSTSSSSSAFPSTTSPLAGEDNWFKTEEDL
jgi:hypothetical protein